MAEKLKVQVWIHGTSEQEASTEASPGARRVLLFRTQPARGEFWQPVTGGVEAGEDVDSAAGREAYEESGLTFSRPPRAIGFEFTFSRGGQAFRESVYEAEADAPAVDRAAAVKLDPREHSEARWVSPAEALAMLRFDSNAQSLRLLMKKWKLPVDPDRRN